MLYNNNNNPKQYISSIMNTGTVKNVKCWSNFQHFRHFSLVSSKHRYYRSVLAVPTNILEELFFFAKSKKKKIKQWRAPCVQTIPSFICYPIKMFEFLYAVYKSYLYTFSRQMKHIYFILLSSRPQRVKNKAWLSKS